MCVTINIDNFDPLNLINIYKLQNSFGYITKAKDRNDQEGILLFIPLTNIDKIIKILED